MKWDGRALIFYCVVIQTPRVVVENILTLSASHSLGTSPIGEAGSTDSEIIYISLK